MCPFFYCCFVFELKIGGLVRLQDLIEKSINAMGYELVDLEQAARGLLRIYIDFLPPEGQDKMISVEDCALVSNHLSRLLMVENVVYERLEVSSPGLDRPLKKFSDYVRFVGAKVVIKLRVPAPGMANRRLFEGILHEPLGETLQLEFEGKEGAAMLSFVIADVDKARLVPQVDFRSRKA
jgi:ribosome maturation factor RimP